MSNDCKSQLVVKLELDSDSYLICFCVSNDCFKLDGPAAIYSTGGKEWFTYNSPHRMDGGPVVIYKNGYRKWWIGGRSIERTMHDF